jgi:hypothetical protein
MTIPILLALVLLLTVLSHILAIRISGTIASATAQMSRFNSKLKIQNSTFEKSPYFRAFLHFQKIELSPTFPLDGGTVPRQKNPWHLQKPHILRGKMFGRFAKNRTVLFDGLKYDFFHGLCFVFLIFSRNGRATRT